MLFTKFVVIFAVIASFGLLHPTSVKAWNGFVRFLITVDDWAIVNLMKVTKEGVARATSPDFFATMSRLGHYLAEQGQSAEEIHRTVTGQIALALAGESEEALVVAQQFANKHHIEVNNVFAKYREWAVNQAT